MHMDESKPSFPSDQANLQPRSDLGADRIALIESERLDVLAASHGEILDLRGA
jgi:hypothetical protein